MAMARLVQSPPFVRNKNSFFRTQALLRPGALNAPDQPGLPPARVEPANAVVNGMASGGAVTACARPQRMNTVLLTHPLRLLNVSIRDGQAWLNATEPR